ncbi:MAG TPA: YegS/Rv2252/BmrU family lipid kinase [Candidatus Caccovicinus merdipullorum]|uniref:YegS/Rv2252/BmrU family lipid kinase n=1 Tax=Candidatus Caccovicinus merdipullorum TaxID=2840724 RepID=A0A9D1GID1_9FIRM|nr:YegS/Rv2252/BmrU family lipid kinase [Candidatus Caccovicinus merdipullorum]
MKKMLFIVNPKSGREQIRSKLLEVLDLFSAAGYEIQIHITQRQKDAAEAAARWGQEKDLVVCSGGDGTLNEVISGMMELPRAPLLGYIPSGSTNDYASSLEIPKQTMDAARNVLEGQPFPIDVGKFCKDRYFVYIAAFGAFTEISYQTSQDKKNLLGHQAYMLEGVKGLGALKSHRMKVEWDGNVLEEEFIFGMVTNTISVGGFKGLVTQSVALNDGEFEVLLIRNPRTPRDLSNIISYMFLKEEPNDYVFKFRAGHIRITSKEPVDWVLDGEFGGSRLEVEVENLKERIQILHSAERP